MAKLTLLLATFTFFLLAANAAIYRTTVVVEDEENGRGPNRKEGSCQQQLQQQRQLRHCRMFLSQRIEGQQQPYGGDNPSGHQQEEREHLQQCCQQLEEVDTQCRCPGLEQVVRSQETQGRLSGQLRRELYQTAQNIPSMCRVRPTQCSFGSGGGYDE